MATPNSQDEKVANTLIFRQYAVISVHMIICYNLSFILGGTSLDHLLKGIHDWPFLMSDSDINVELIPLQVSAPSKNNVLFYSQ